MTMITCPICNGLGKIKEFPIKDSTVVDYEICPNCKGTGLIEKHEISYILPTIRRIK